MPRKNPSLLTYAIAGVGAFAAYKLFFDKKSEASEVAKKEEKAPAETVVTETITEAPPAENFIPPYDPLAATPIAQMIPVTMTLPELVPPAPVTPVAQEKVPTIFTPVAVAQPVFTPIGKSTGQQTLDPRYVNMIASPAQQSLPAYLGGKGLFQPSQLSYMQTPGMVMPPPPVMLPPKPPQLSLADYVRMKKQLEAGLRPQVMARQVIVPKFQPKAPLKVVPKSSPTLASKVKSFLKVA
jgi:hypothetical protein